ncbi:MAG: hypothetical protein SNJ59_00310 [Aggregatilineales bacterium]
MAVIEITEPRPELTQRQRWSHYFVLLFALLSLLIGINLRDNTLFATVLYVNPAAGIRAFYPESWLLDSDGPYVFRVRDMSQIGFKTTIQVSTLPVTLNTTPRNLLDNLILSRSQTLSAFSVLSRGEPYPLPDDVIATSMRYIFVDDTTSDPFLERIPVVVEGIDVLTIQGGQAIVLTFLADSATYDTQFPIFQRFVNDFNF